MRRVCAAFEGKGSGGAGDGVASLSLGSGLGRAFVEDGASLSGRGVVVDGSVTVPVLVSVSRAVSIPVSVSLPCAFPTSSSRYSESGECPSSESCELGTSPGGRMGRGGVSEDGGGGGGGGCVDMEMVR